MSFFVASLLYLYMGHLLGISLGLFHHKIALYTLFYFASIPLLMSRVSWSKFRLWSHLKSRQELKQEPKVAPNLEAEQELNLKTEPEPKVRMKSATSRYGLYFLLSVGQLIFIHSMVRSSHIIYPDDFKIRIFFEGLLRVSQILSVLCVLVVGGTFLTEALGRRQNSLGMLYRSLALTLMIVLVFAQFLVPMLSPSPFIDVFVSNTAAVDFFLNSKNPYSQTYIDIYAGELPYSPGFLYFPGLLFLLAPFRALFGDIRYSFIFAQILNVILIYRITKRREAPGTNSFLPWLLPVLWLSFPVTYHVLEQSWTDTLLIAFTFLIVDSIDLRRWAWVGVLAGLVFTTKQYGFIISLFAVLRVAQMGGWKQALRCMGLAAGAFSIVLVPFLLANFKGLYAMTIHAQTGQGIRTDSLGMTALFALKWGYYLPGFAQVLITLFGIVGGVWMIRVDPLKRTDRVAVALFFSYGCSFLFGKWAFCNYHYLLASFLILYLATEREARASFEVGQKALGTLEPESSSAWKSSQPIEKPLYT